MDHKYSIGIGLNLFDARAILLRDDGKQITQIEKERKDITANETIKVLLELVEDILNSSKKYRERIVGIGLALGGIIDGKKGIVYWPQRQDSSYVYISIPLKKYLEEKFKLPVLLENDANACVWAEHIRNFPKYKNIIYMFSGVGCGILIEGSLYRGRNGAAGELFVYPHRIMRSLLGDFSFLAHWPLDLEVTKRAKELIALGKNTSLIKRITPTGDLSIKDIFNEAKDRDRLSRDILKEAAFSLGVKISFLINLINPEAVIIGGGFEEAGDLFLEEIHSVIKKFSFSEMRRNLKITSSKLGREATSLGVSYLVFEENPLHK